MTTQHGLVWKSAFLGIQPCWTVEPDIGIITKIVRQKMQFPAGLQCEVKYFAEGSFNKVYIVRCCRDKEYIMRVSLPVHPRFKTMSERATIEYIRHHTDIPAPRIFHYDASNKNELGFEGMIMARVPGTKLQGRWRSMTWLKKELLLRKTVQYFGQLFHKRFNRLGNLYATDDLQRLPTRDIPDTVLLGTQSSTESTNFCLSEIVSMPFFQEQNLTCNVERGPFKQSRKWLAARMELHLFELNQYSDESDDDDVDDDPCNSPDAVHNRAQRINKLLPRVFCDNEPEEFILHHDDLNTGNILVDENDEITGIIDWECVNTVPLWYACQKPKFLQTRQDRHEPPNPDHYQKNLGGNEPDDPDSVYYDHLEEYEKTQLWEFFLAEMGRVCPEWLAVYENKNSRLKVIFSDVVTYFGEAMHSRAIDRWLDLVETTGIVPSIAEVKRMMLFECGLISHKI